MDDQNKNLILATVLSFLVILVWYTLFAPPPPPATAPGTQVEATAPADGTGAAGTGTAAGAGADAAPATDALAGAPRILIDTPRITGSISLMGGRIDDLSLKDYREEVDPASPIVRLLVPAGQEGALYALYGWAPGAGLGFDRVPGARTLWSLESGDALSVGKPVTLRWDNGAGLVFTRTISVDDNYMFTVAEKVTNSGSAPATLYPYGIVARKGIPAAIKNFFILHEGPIQRADGVLTEIKYKNLAKADPVEAEGGVPAEVTEVAANGWIGFTDHYWQTILVPEPGQAFTAVAKYTPATDTFQTEARLPVMTVAPGDSAEVSTMLFAGAKEWETIRAYQNEGGIEGFLDSIDWGWFFFITKPMFAVLHWLHGTIGNMGWAIIALTFIMKALVFPLARKSYISMARMKELQPQMEALKERTGDDRQRFQKEMMELYKREKVNPASGCLPILIQIPIFFSLYKVIFVTLELRHAPWIGFVKDLSAPDPTSLFNLFGLLPWGTPEVGSFFHIFSIGVLPICLGISMWLQQKLTPAPTDPTQAAVFAWMPWIFMFMLGGFASGLVLYWITNNLITFAQQYTIMSMHGKRPDIFDNIRGSFRRKKDGTGTDASRK
ncbi:MAG: membrane protein insertase YidC [Rhodobacteraceae bacterium]|nr:membrane protein insertase YidC [Paracoccaceae bacterium]